MGTSVWTLIRNDYEIMHSDVKELSIRHNVSESMIRVAIEDGGWTYQDPDEAKLESYSERLHSMEVHHQMTLVPKFIALQAKMLDCCDTLLDKVREIEDAPHLRTVSEVLEKHRPAIMGVKKETQIDNVLKINILNKVGDGPDVSVSAIQISATAGATNGIGAMEYSGNTDD